MEENSNPMPWESEPGTAYAETLHRAVVQTRLSVALVVAVMFVLLLLAGMSRRSVRMTDSLCFAPDTLCEQRQEQVELERRQERRHDDLIFGLVGVMALGALARPFWVHTDLMLADGVVTLSGGLSRRRKADAVDLDTVKQGIRRGQPTVVRLHNGKKLRMMSPVAGLPRLIEALAEDGIKLRDLR